jgi:hypothetical protein
MMGWSHGGRHASPDGDKWRIKPVLFYCYNKHFILFIGKNSGYGCYYLSVLCESIFLSRAPTSLDL